jgi:nucleotide-binding universal stress UspA family protein
MTTILAGTDTSGRADLAVEEAARLARLQDAELTVVYVRPPIESREVFDPDKAPDPEAYLRRLRARFADVSVRTRVERGDPAEGICRVAREEGAELIVVGNRGIDGHGRWFTRSVPARVANRAPCSVYVVDTRRAA